MAEPLRVAHPPLATLATCLQNLNDPVPKRMRAIYYLRLINNTEAIEVLSQALLDRRNSQLVRHELAYVLGQMQKSEACNVLQTVLDDGSEDTMVRHECAEALGAIGDIGAVPTLERGTKPVAGQDGEEVNPTEVRETCTIALDLIRWKVAGRQGEAPLYCACMSPYTSVDPAPPNETDLMSTADLEKQLMDESRSLFDRYRAMFSLRNRVPGTVNAGASSNSTRCAANPFSCVTLLSVYLPWNAGGDSEAVAALGRALVNDKTSVLFRHEVAYVLGQTQSPVGLAALRESLSRKGEHAMVRHEAAEALGASSQCGVDTQVAGMQLIRHMHVLMKVPSLESGTCVVKFWSSSAMTRTSAW